MILTPRPMLVGNMEHRMSDELKALIEKARAWFDALSPAEKEAHIAAQRASWVRAEMSWPAPKFHWEGGTKVYESYEDYVND